MIAPMTFGEYSDWIKSAKYIVTQEFERDEEDIIWSMEVYEKDGWFYLIERGLNNESIPLDFKNKLYLPVLAKKASWMEYHCEYFPAYQMG